MARAVTCVAAVGLLVLILTVLVTAAARDGLRYGLFWAKSMLHDYAPIQHISCFLRAWSWKLNINAT